MKGLVSVSWLIQQLFNDSAPGVFFTSDKEYRELNSAFWLLHKSQSSVEKLSPHGALPSFLISICVCVKAWKSESDKGRVRVCVCGFARMCDGWHSSLSAVPPSVGAAHVQDSYISCCSNCGSFNTCTHTTHPVRQVHVSGRTRWVYCLSADCDLPLPGVWCSAYFLINKSLQNQKCVTACLA